MGPHFRGWSRHSMPFASSPAFHTVAVRQACPHQPPEQRACLAQLCLDLGLGEALWILAVDCDCLWSVLTRPVVHAAVPTSLQILELLLAWE